MERKTVVRIAAAALAWIVTVMWGIFIYSMSAEDSVKSGKTSGKVVESVASAVIPNYNKLPEKEKTEVKSKLSLPVRKLAHFAEFGILGALVMTSVKLTFDKKYKLRYYLLMSLLLGVAYAVSDELHQASVPGRAPKVTDVLIDSTGVLLGILFIAMIVWILEKRKRRLII